AASSAGDLAQDLWIGRALGSSTTWQLGVKWIGAMLSVPFVTVIFGALVPSLGYLVDTKRIAAPQAVALHNIVPLAGASWFVPIAAGAVCFCAARALNASAILLGVGMLMNPRLTTPMLIGSLLGASLTRRQGSIPPQMEAAI